VHTREGEIEGDREREIEGEREREREREQILRLRGCKGAHFRTADRHNQVNGDVKKCMHAGEKNGGVEWMPSMAKASM
jgi:hypothetical protein